MAGCREDTVTPAAGVLRTAGSRSAIRSPGALSSIVISPLWSRVTRTDERQAETRAGCRARVLQPHEAIADALTILDREARAAIGHRDLDRAAAAHRRDRYTGRGSVRRPTILQRVVDEVGHGLTDQLAAAVHDEMGIDAPLQKRALALGDRFVELADIAGDIGGIELGHAVAAGAGLGARDHQQRVEDADHAVGVVDHLLQHLAEIIAGASQAQRLLGAAAQPRQRSLQVVGDVVGHFLHPGHELGDAIEHGVEAGNEPIELVVGARHRQAAGQVALGDPARLDADAVDAMQHASRHHQAADRGDGGKPGQRVEQRPPQDRRQGVALGEIMADQQTKAAGEGEDARQGAALLPLDEVGGLDDAGLVDDAGGQGGDVADQRLAGMGRDEGRGPRPGCLTRWSTTSTSLVMPPSTYCSERPPMSASTVCVTCSWISALTFQPTDTSTSAAPIEVMTR